MLLHDRMNYRLSSLLIVEPDRLGEQPPPVVVYRLDPHVVLRCGRLVVPGRCVDSMQDTALGADEVQFLRVGDGGCDLPAVALHVTQPRPAARFEGVARAPPQPGHDGLGRERRSLHQRRAIASDVRHFMRVVGQDAVDPLPPAQHLIPEAKTTLDTVVAGVQLQVRRAVPDGRAHVVRRPMPLRRPGQRMIDHNERRPGQLA